MLDNCLPAKLYVILTIISILLHLLLNYSNNTNNNNFIKKSKSSPYTLSAICCKLIIMVIWTILLNWLCTTGHSNIAWVIFLLPLIIIIGIFALITGHVILNQS